MGDPAVTKRRFGQNTSAMVQRGMVYLSMVQLNVWVDQSPTWSEASPLRPKLISSVGISHGYCQPSLTLAFTNHHAWTSFVTGVP